jgi:hypothetical protein
VVLNHNETPEVPTIYRGFYVDCEKLNQGVVRAFPMGLPKAKINSNIANKPQKMAPNG